MLGLARSCSITRSTACSQGRPELTATAAGAGAMAGAVGTDVSAGAGGSVTVVGPMAIGKSYIGKYVSHCHILEHEENDMMMRFTIV